MTYPSIIFWLLFFRAAFSNLRTLLILLFSSFTFGALSVLPPELTGGASFVPKTMFALLIVMKYLVPEILTFSPRLIELMRAQNLGFLLAFLVIGVLTTIFAPSLFSGAISVVPLKVIRFAFTEPLIPSPANMTQSIYLSVSVAATFAMAIIARSPQFPDQLLSALVIGGIVLLGSGIADMAATAVGQSGLLEPFRNANYGMMTNAEVAGLRRVVGLMPEASSYGSACVSFAAALTFLRPSYEAGFPRMVASLTALSLILMALLSTSSSAYAGLTIFGCAQILNVIRRLAGASPIGQVGLAAELGVGILAVVCVLLTLIAQPELFDPLLRLVDEVILNKAASDSFFERSLWNQVGWQAFWSSYGLGVGLGSTRTSNYFIAVISNTGFFGTACFLIFLVQTFLRRSTASLQSSEMVAALKLASIPFLGMAALGSATPDFEPWLAVIFGAITGLSLQPSLRPLAEPYAKVSPYDRAEAHLPRTRR